MFELSEFLESRRPVRKATQDFSRRLPSHSETKTREQGLPPIETCLTQLHFNNQLVGQTKNEDDEY